MLPKVEHWKGRAARLTLAVIVHILAVLIAYFFSPPIKLKKPEVELQVTMLPSADDKHDKPKPKTRAAKRASAAVPKAAQPPVPPVPSPLNLMVVSSDVFRAGDISKIHSNRDNPSPEFAADDSAGADHSPGEGPGGAKLYNAEWYREPTDAEMNYYMPKNLRQSGWGLIICRTMADYRVEDCRELEESPPGSGMARGMRQAAWQFRVRPPRVGGKPMVGAWVRIRFDLRMGFTK